MKPELQRVTSTAKLPARPRDAHKGDFGRVLVVGGSRGMIGAVSLAANAALRSGAGLVTLAAPRTVQLAAATLCPCATSLPLTCDAEGKLSAACVPEVLAAASNCDVLAIGPGMGLGTAQQNVVRAAMEQSKPLVIDADGLNNLAKIDGWARLRVCPLVLTPHPGEFARLTGRSVTEIQSDRNGAAVLAARTWFGEAGDDAPPLVVVLKGADTVVTDAARMYVNDTGNPGLATGGSGDVLTGVTAALIAQDLAPFEAACLAARVHGRAGDIAAEQLGEPSLIATDLLEYLPPAMRELAR